MIEIKNKLFKAFAEDHAVLGNGFHILSAKLREGNLADIKNAAQKINDTVGAHIAFEEYEFYPRLKEERPNVDTDKMYDEHSEGLNVILDIIDLSDTADISDEFKNRQLEHISVMERHVAECGELFSVLDILPDDELSRLYERLLYWRKENPKWSDVSSYKE